MAIRTRASADELIAVLERLIAGVRDGRVTIEEMSAAPERRQRIHWETRSITYEDTGRMKLEATWWE